jgi:hypothetical protein
MARVLPYLLPYLLKSRCQRLSCGSGGYGLYYVGHRTRPGGGITPVIVSAMRVAELITGT